LITFDCRQFDEKDNGNVSGKTNRLKIALILAGILVILLCLANIITNILLLITSMTTTTIGKNKLLVFK